MISVGAKKDLLLMLLAKAIIVVSQEDLVQDVVPTDNKADFSKLLEIIDGISSKLITDMETHDWLKKKTQSKLLKFLTWATNQNIVIQLDMFAVYILLTNFCERGGKPLHEGMVELSHISDVYFDILDGLKVSNPYFDDEMEAEAMQLAYKAVKFLKE